jgi:hypothetical protein
MALFIPPIPALDNNGNPIDGAEWRFFRSGTSTPAAVYSDSDLGTSLGSAVQAGTGGRFPAIYLDPDTTYRARLYDGAGSPITNGDFDPYNSDGGGTNYVTFEQFGAVGDGVTDDYAAITAAIASLFPFGGIIRCRPVAYRSSQRVILTCPVSIIGAGNGVRSLTYGEGAVVNGWDNYTGTRFVFPASTAGFFLPLHTDELNANDVVANRGATGSNAKYWEYANGELPSLRHLTVYSLGGTGSDKHGIEARCPHVVSDVTIYGFPGDGHRAIGDLGGSTDPYGNTSISQIYNVSARSCGYNGFSNFGRDSNIITYLGCNSSTNGAWGIKDESLLGNTYVGCHLAGNNRLLRASANASVGAVQCEGTVARSVFYGCYVEGGNGSISELGPYCQVIGGIMATTAYANRNIGMVIDGDTLREAGWRAQRRNSSDALTVAVTFGAQRGEDPGLTGVLGYGSQDHVSIADGLDSTRLHYQSSSRNWAWFRPGVFAAEWMGHYTDHSTERKIGAFFRNGIYLGSPNDTLHNHIAAAATAPEDGKYVVGDIRFKKSPAAAGKIGWVCTTAGTKASTAWASGVAAAVLTVSNSPQLASHRTNGGNVYRLTTNPGVGTTATAPVHGAGEVIGADGFGWTFVNATTVPVFKEWGVIDA